MLREYRGNIAGQGDCYEEAHEPTGAVPRQAAPATLAGGQKRVKSWRKTSGNHHTGYAQHSRAASGRSAQWRPISNMSKFLQAREAFATAACIWLYEYHLKCLPERMMAFFQTEELSCMLLCRAARAPR
jgi:hypothetical protein